jgi:Icc-related predicted phosphoesterase
LRPTAVEDTVPLRGTGLEIAPAFRFHTGVASFVYASDLHGNKEAYERLFALEADAVVLGGDLLPYPLKLGGDLLEVQLRFVEWLGPVLDRKPSYWIPGNDDWAVAAAALEGHGTALHGRAVPFLAGFSIAGYACVPVTPFGMKDYDRVDVAGWTPAQPARRSLRSTPEGVVDIPLDEVFARPTIEADLDALAALSDPARTIYVAHTPPYATSLDRLNRITPIGSRALRAFIERRVPPLTLHGHLHESAGIERLGGTVCANPGDSMHRLRALRIELPALTVAPV